MVYPGKWHGDEQYFGLHYDFHARADDTDLGTRCSEAELVPMLELMAPDFVQTDCKGGAGYTSWFSKVPNASVPAGLTHDALLQWRQATRKLGLPLHCHYAGIWDTAAGEKHPEWSVVAADANVGDAPVGQNFWPATQDVMCPRSPYLDELLIPQFLEVIDRYEVDGFWVDGDIVAVRPCYCSNCLAAWTEKTGLGEAPTTEDHPEWTRWWNFTLESYYEFVTKYCDVVHRHKPGVLVCSNWLQTFRNPGAPTVPTDWISGDNAYMWGIDGSRCEARFLSTRGKPWDIMLWNFYKNRLHDDKPDSPWTVKPPQMVMQEAAVILAFGGNVQLYEQPPVRDGRLIPWRQKRMGEISAFVKARRATCQHTATIAQIAVLHSEDHLYSDVRGNELFRVDAAPVQGAVYALLGNSYGVDILDEWALIPRLSEFPLVVAPEQTRMSERMVGKLKAYVEGGGNLLVTGSDMFERFGETFLGFRSVDVESEKSYDVPAADGSVPIYSRKWRLGEATTAAEFGRLGRGCLLEDRLTPYPGAVINQVGKGLVAYVPADLFRDFEHNRYPLTRSFIGSLAERLLPDPDIRVKAPGCIDVSLRRRKETRIIHFVNRISGNPNTPHDCAIDEIPPMGPIAVRMRINDRPASVTIALEDGELTWEWSDGWLTARVAAVHIHAALVVNP